VKNITNDMIGEEQGGVRKGKGCVDQIFNLRMIVEKILAKRKKVYAAFIDLEKASDRIDWKALWDVLRMYGVGGRLLSGVKAFYKGANACVKVNGKVVESFRIHGGVRQGCVMSPWLFNLFMDGVVREVKARAGDGGIELCTDEAKWKLNTLLFADDTVLVAENERDLQKLVEEFNTVCQRRKLKVNVKKSKVMIFEREEHDVIDFGNPYRVRTECK